MKISKIFDCPGTECGTHFLDLDNDPGEGAFGVEATPLKAPWCRVCGVEIWGIRIEGTWTPEVP